MPLLMAAVMICVGCGDSVQSGSKETGRSIGKADRFLRVIGCDYEQVLKQLGPPRTESGGYGGGRAWDYGASTRLLLFDSKTKRVSEVHLDYASEGAPGQPHEFRRRPAREILPDYLLQQEPDEINGDVGAPSEAVVVWHRDGITYTLQVGGDPIDPSKRPALFSVEKHVDTNTGEMTITPRPIKDAWKNALAEVLTATAQTDPE